jgi:hypothetical protein
MVLPLLVPLAVFALWVIPKAVDKYDSRKHSNRKGKGKK